MNGGQLVPMLLAASTVEPTKNWMASFSSSLRTAFIILGPILAVTLIVLVWAIFFRKPGRRRVRRRHRHYRRDATPTAAKSLSRNGRSWFRWRRHRHARHYPERQVNPTLAQTRGLPPVRSEPEQPDSPH